MSTGIVTFNTHHLLSNFALIDSVDNVYGIRIGRLPAQETKRSDQDPSSQGAHAVPWNVQR